MSETEEYGNPPFDATYVNDTIRGLGGVNALRERKDEFHLVVVRMDQERASLMDKYPNKWVAVGRDGVLAVADSMEDVFSEIESAGLSGSEFEVEYMDSDPPDLIL